MNLWPDRSWRRGSEESKKIADEDAVGDSGQAEEQIKHLQRSWVPPRVAPPPHPPPPAECWHSFQTSCPAHGPGSTWGL